MDNIQYGGHFPSSLDLSKLPGLPDDLRNRAAPLAEDKELQQKCIVQFFQAAHFLGHESEKAGYPKFETRDYVRIVISEVETFVTDLPFITDKLGNRRPHWKRQYWINRCRSLWDTYEQTSSGEVGTPLSFLPGADMSLVATLQMSGVKTAEQLVQLQGDALEHITGALQLRDKAHSYLDSTKALQVKTDEAETLKAQRDEALKLLAEFKAKLEQDNEHDTRDSAGRSEQNKREASGDADREQRPERQKTASTRTSARGRATK